MFWYLLHLFIIRDDICPCVQKVLWFKCLLNKFGLPLMRRKSKVYSGVLKTKLTELCNGINVNILKNAKPWFICIMLAGLPAPMFLYESRDICCFT